MKYKQIFNSGVTFQQFYDTAQDRYKNYANNAIRNYLNLERDLEKVSSIISKFNILAIEENWCIDSIINIPVVHWLEKNNENIRLKVIDTDSYSKFMPNGKVITPTFIIMNQ
ncbi:thioredoxin family protein [Anaerococcus sp. Marseille-Q5996]|uniref:Thioredoxin family protein n=1 Tax=Anaerococcus groningensis TaxID=3115616 RepID=A0ABW9N186_9FIRM|nr:thioredoxin family protein [Anaerococcus sp. Marseille-Q5996]